MFKDKKKTMPEKRNTIYREMVMDLIYRLRLAEDMFCQATDGVMSAIGMDDIAGKMQAVEQLRSYSLSLQVIHADFLRVIEGQHAVFPPEVSLWQWNEPNGDECIVRTLERLHLIEEGMEQKLNDEMVKMEVAR